MCAVAAALHAITAAMWVIADDVCAVIEAIRDVTADVLVSIT